MSTTLFGFAMPQRLHEKVETWSFSGIMLSKQVLTKDGPSGEVGMKKGRRAILEERPRVLRKWKQPPEMPTSTFIAVELRKGEPRSDWSGPHCLEPISILSDAMTQTDSESSTRTTCDASVHACPPVATISIQMSMAVDHDLPMDPISINNLCSCAAPLPPHTNTSVQIISTDIPSSSTQTSPPPLVNVDVQTSVTMESSSPVSRLDWAEDATSLPILPLLPISSVPHQCAPRDFSGLRSSGLNPFGSLQHCSKQVHPRVSSRFHQNISFSQSSHPCYRLPPLCPSSSFPKLQISPQASKNKPFVSPPSSCTSALDWNQDPRLSDLSRALKALGWTCSWPWWGHCFQREGRDGPSLGPSHSD